MAETLSSYLEAANAELKAKQEALMKRLEPLEPYRYDWSLETRILSILHPQTGEILRELPFISLVLTAQKQEVGAGHGVTTTSQGHTS